MTVILPVNLHIFDAVFQLDAGFLVECGLILLLSALATLAMARYASERFETNKKRTALCFTVFGLCVTLIMICLFGCTAIAVKGIFLAYILAFSSFEDVKTRECADYLHLMIVIAAFIGTDLSNLPGMILAAFSTGGVIVLSKLIGKGKIGGADIKLAAASAFLLGFDRGILGLLTGTLLAVLVNMFKKNRKAGFPMIPYLAAGFMAAFFIQG
ncbi:MAG: prepilin peptidase [Oscillospiraceae bacterium]|nr:prepilin peptidase [Oscillospiraceae bacterium]